MTIFESIELAGEHIFKYWLNTCEYYHQYLQVLSQYLQVLSRRIHPKICISDIFGQFQLKNGSNFNSEKDCLDMAHCMQAFATYIKHFASKLFFKTEV